MSPPIATEWKRNGSGNERILFMSMKKPPPNVAEAVNYICDFFILFAIFTVYLRFPEFICEIHEIFAIFYGYLRIPINTHNSS